MRKLLIAGNWKMHLNTMQASILMHRLQERVRIYRDIEVVVAPSMLVLQPISLQLDRRKFRLAAQNAYHKDEGAYTGEVSFTMLRDLVHYVIIGHSERRHVFGETLQDIALKVEAANRNGIAPILCVGETKTERLEGHTKRILHDQVVSALKGLTSQEVEDIVIAYEPVWAIGTGKTATSAQAQDAHAHVRSVLEELSDKATADKIRIQYGGSVKPANAKELLGQPDIDGALVGGASLEVRSFAEIVKAGQPA